jgi:hypothetical protein
MQLLQVVHTACVEQRVRAVWLPYCGQEVSLFLMQSFIRRIPLPDCAFHRGLAKSVRQSPVGKRSHRKIDGVVASQRFAVGEKGY